MTRIDYFKLQAKNFMRDYKTQFRDESDGLYSYKPRFFDVDEIVVSFDIDEDSTFTLMNAQHIIAHLAGFSKWTDLIKASEARLELAKLLFDNRDKIENEFGPECWEMYEHENLKSFDDKSKLVVFKHIFLGEKTIIEETRFETKAIHRKMDNPVFDSDPFIEHDQIVDAAYAAVEREKEYAKKYLGGSFLKASPGGKIKLKEYGIPNCECRARTAYVFNFYSSEEQSKHLFVLNCPNCADIYYVYQEEQ